MPHDEIAHVLELAFHGFRMPLLNRQPAPLVVAIRAPGRRMTGTTDQRLTSSRNTVPVQPNRIVPQKGLRD
jgi:hypothetical protein